MSQSRILNSEHAPTAFCEKPANLWHMAVVVAIYDSMEHPTTAAINEERTNPRLGRNCKEGKKIALRLQLVYGTSPQSSGRPCIGIWIGLTPVKRLQEGAANSSQTLHHCSGTHKAKRSDLQTSSTWKGHQEAGRSIQAAAQTSS